MKYLQKFLTLANQQASCAVDDNGVCKVSAVSVSGQVTLEIDGKIKECPEINSGLELEPQTQSPAHPIDTSAPAPDGHLVPCELVANISPCTGVSPTPPTLCKVSSRREQLIAIYMERFINRLDVWSKQWVTTDGRGGYAFQEPSMSTYNGRFSYEPVSPHLVARHLAGKVTCAWTAIEVNYCGKWICFDSDKADGALDALDTALRSWGVHVIREGRRPGRDGHLWILFDRPVRADQLITLADAMMNHAGISGLERFPKSATTLSQVRGPLGINLKPEANGARGWFDGVEQNITAQLLWLAAQPLNRADDAIKEATRQAPPVRPVPRLRTHGSYNYRGSECFNILKYVEYRQQGNGFIAACPCCVADGHDQHRDNLRISLDGAKFCCVFGGPNEVHKVVQIIQMLKGADHGIN